jgi:hypothetical protein
MEQKKETTIDKTKKKSSVTIVYYSPDAIPVLLKSLFIPDIGASQ